MAKKLMQVKHGALLADSGCLCSQLDGLLHECKTRVYSKGAAYISFHSFSLMPDVYVPCTMCHQSGNSLGRWEGATISCVLHLLEFDLGCQGAREFSPTSVTLTTEKISILTSSYCVSLPSLLSSSHTLWEQRRGTWAETQPSMLERLIGWITLQTS